LFKPHTEKQEEVFLTEKRISIAATGIQWGKTTVGVMRLLMDMFKFTSAEDNFIVTAPTYKILYQSTLPVFKAICDGRFGHYHKENECFRIKGGGMVWFRTGQNPDSVVGITNVRHILCDEAGLYSRYFWDNIQARSSIKRCPITIVTSPYSLNWLWTDFIRKHRNGDEYVRKLVHLCQATSKENPYFPEEEYNDRLRTMDPRRFNMLYGGVFDRAVGLVYDCFDISQHVIDSFLLPVGTRYFGGIDWGYTDPCVIKVRAVTETGMHYSISEVCQTQLRVSDIIDHCVRLKNLYKIEKFFCDPSRPEYIEELNRKGLNAQPAANAIVMGIEKHYALIKGGDYFVFKENNKHTIDEYETYHYADPKDLKPDQGSNDKINLPVDQSNHTMDCERYISMGTWRIGHAKNRVVNQDTSVIPFREISQYDTNMDKLIKRRRNADISL